jgi:hypothetical protein
MSYEAFHAEQTAALDQFMAAQATALKKFKREQHRLKCEWDEKHPLPDKLLKFGRKYKTIKEAAIANPRYTGQLWYRKTKGGHAFYLDCCGREDIYIEFWFEGVYNREQRLAYERMSAPGDCYDSIEQARAKHPDYRGIVWVKKINYGDIIAGCYFRHWYAPAYNGSKKDYENLDVYLFMESPPCYRSNEFTIIEFDDDGVYDKHSYPVKCLCK